MSIRELTPIVDPFVIPHKRVECFSCGYTGVELTRILPEGEGGIYTQAQLYALDVLARSHERTAHGNKPAIVRIQPYERE